MEVVDIAIVGRGPAGLSAALNAAVRRRSVLLFGPEGSEKLEKTEEVQNYLGLPHIQGKELMARFRRHLEEYPQLSYREEMVQTVYRMGDTIGLLLPDNSVIETRSLILATGINYGRPVEGEDRFLGRGVSSCASCDAALYKGKKAVVIGYNALAAEEAAFIDQIDEETLFVNMTGRKVELPEGIELVDDPPLAVQGGERAERLLLKSGRVLEADGFFFIRDAKKADQLVPGLAMEGPHIQVDSDMATSLEGIFACGDCTGLPYQIAKAVGQGQLAGFSAARFVSSRAK